MLHLTIMQKHLPYKLPPNIIDDDNSMLFEDNRRLIR